MRHRSKIQMLADHHNIIQYVLQGLTQEQIVARLQADPDRPEDEPVSRSMISRDLKRIKTLWRKEQIEATTEYINIQVAQCRYIQQQAWEAWHKSKVGHIRKKTTERPSTMSATGSPIPPMTIEEVVKESRSGESPYLMVILRAEERISRLLGLDQPVDVKGEIGMVPIILRGAELLEPEPENDD